MEVVRFGLADQTRFVFLFIFHQRPATLTNFIEQTNERPIPGAKHIYRQVYFDIRVYLFFFVSQYV